MSDFDINSPSADRGHEAIRVAVVQAITDLTSTRADSDDSFTLVGVLLDLVGSVLTQIGTHQTAIDDLTKRITALEPPVFTPPTP